MPHLWFPHEVAILQHLVLLDSIDIIFIQETMGPCYEVEHTLSTMFTNWNFYVVDVRGRFGGVDIGINYKTVQTINFWGHHNYVATDIFSK